MPTFENDPVAVQVTSTAPAIKAVSVNHTPQAGPAVQGISDAVGCWGESNTWMGVFGFTRSTTGGAGVMGQGDPGPGVIGKSSKWIGVYGETDGIENGPAGVWGEHKGAGTGIKAVSKDGAGLAAFSSSNEAVHAETNSPGTAAIAAFNLNPAGTGAALFAKKAGTVGHAGFFDGRVFVSGDLDVGGDIKLLNADCAENFDLAPTCDAEPGTVVRLTDGGAVVPSSEPYDHRAAGVVSGAGSYRPGLLLDSAGGERRRPVAMFGKVFCKVDADVAAIGTGDLLTTSAIPGHAMKATDREKAFGAVIGKALAPLANGRGLIPILVALN